MKIKDCCGGPPKGACDLLTTAKALLVLRGCGRGILTGFSLGDALGRPAGDFRLLAKNILSLPWYGVGPL